MVRVGSAAYEIRIGLSRGRTKEARPAGPQAWGRRGRPFTLHLWGEWYSWSWCTTAPAWSRVPWPTCSG